MLQDQLTGQMEAGSHAGLLLSEGGLARRERLLERLGGHRAMQSLPAVDHLHHDPFIEQTRPELDRHSLG